jgi:G3E family GTPase
MASVKVIMVAGHFASGKTTLVMKMVEALTKRGHKVGLLMNDVGTVDYKMVASLTNYPVEEISKHCLCLKQNDLKEALRKLLAADHDVIVIEAIGFADPHNCWMTLSEVLPTISPNTELGAITVAVDGELLTRTYQGSGSSLHPIMAQQLSEAEIIAINKVDLLGLESLNSLKEMVGKTNERAKIIYISALTGMGIDGLVELSLASKWSQPQSRSSEGVMKRRAEWCTGLVWSAYVVNLQLDTSEAITEVVGKTLLEMARGILRAHGETVRIKAYCDNPAGRVYLSITPDLRIEYMPGVYAGEKVKGLKFAVSCLAKRIETGDMTTALKEALSQFKGKFLITKL